MKWLLGVLFAGLAAPAPIAGGGDLWQPFAGTMGVQYRTSPTPAGAEVEIKTISVMPVTIYGSGETEIWYARADYRLNCEWGTVRKGPERNVKPGSERLDPLPWPKNAEADLPYPDSDGAQLLAEVCGAGSAPTGRRLTLLEAEKEARGRTASWRKGPIPPPARIMPRPPIEVPNDYVPKTPQPNFPRKAGERWTLTAMDESNNGMMFLDTGEARAARGKIRARLLVAIREKGERPNAALREVEFDCAAGRVRQLKQAVWLGFGVRPQIGKDLGWMPVVARSAVGRALESACQGGGQGRSFDSLSATYDFVRETGQAKRPRYPEWVRNNVLNGCRDGGGSAPVCGCALRSIERELTLDEFAEADTAIQQKRTTPLVTRLQKLHAACMKDPNLL
ncbi:MAG: hypothetical protein JWR84_4212 [Caulobacter sp.]|nr:hypothetical protein [Caulobacter sp.]